MRKLMWAALAVTLCLTTAPSLWAQIVINEVVYDPPAGGTDSLSEWIELYNVGTEDVDLTNWRLCDNGDSIGEPFPGIVISAGQHLVFACSVDSLLQYYPSATNYVAWTSGSFGDTRPGSTAYGLANGADMLVLLDAGGSVVDQMNWGTPTTTWPSWIRFGGWNPGTPDPSAGYSIGRSPDGFDSDQVSDWASFVNPTPGASNGGAVVYTPHTIYEIQYGGNLTDTAVSVVGIITSNRWCDSYGGALADAPGPWHGIQLYSGSALTVSRGDSVEVRGTVAEYNGKTEIMVSQIITLGTGTIPAATDVSLADIKTGSPNAESYEGVLVRIPKSLTLDTTWMSPTYGEWAVSNGQDTLRIDNTSNTYGIYYARPAVGDSVAITGILNYTFNNFKLMPRDSADVVNYGPTGAAGNPEAASYHFRLAPCQPNPATRQTRISFSLGTQAKTRVSIFNILGQEVRRLSDGLRPAGEYSMAWDLRDNRGSQVPNGIYILRLNAGSEAATRKVIVLR